MRMPRDAIPPKDSQPNLRSSEGEIVPRKLPICPKFLTPSRCVPPTVQHRYGFSGDPVFSLASIGHADPLRRQHHFHDIPTNSGLATYHDDPYVARGSHRHRRVRLAKRRQRAQ
jgi:hypothetical protein